MFKVIFVLLIIVSTVVCENQSARRCARAANSCLLAPGSTEGPYYWNSTVRQDITEGKGGIPFRLTIKVLDTTTCSSLSNVLVDIWHCDAAGVYSHFIAASLGQNNGKTDNSTFFRGQQVTNQQGTAVFNTVYPGWYRGRATHMHVKVHVGATFTNINGAIHVKGGHVSHTGQLFFDDTINDQVAKISPYAAQTTRRTRNNEDFIYLESKGSTMIVPVQYLSSSGLKGAVTGEITLGVDPNAVVTSNDGPPPRPPRPPPGR